MIAFHDYAYYLQVLEKNLKQLEKKCLHQDYDIDQNVSDMMRAMSGLLVWVEDVQQESQK